MAATVLGRKPKPGESNGWGCGGRPIGLHAVLMLDGDEAYDI